MQDNRNLILAIALSLAVLFVWQFFIAGPELDRARRQQQAQEQSATAPAPTLPQAAAPAASAEAATLPREEALARSPRARIATPSLAGSINLTGARIDDPPRCPRHRPRRRPRRRRGAARPQPHGIVDERGRRSYAPILPGGPFGLHHPVVGHAWPDGLTLPGRPGEPSDAADYSIRRRLSASATAAVRSDAPSFSKMCSRWVFTVSGEMYSRSAMSRFV